MAKKITKDPGKKATPGKKKEAVAKRPKNYNYQNAVTRELEENPSALGRVSKKKSEEIVKSFDPKRKEWNKEYLNKRMTKSAYKDSVASTLPIGAKAKDFMVKKSDYKVKPKKVKYWVGGSVQDPWVSWESPNIFGTGRKRKK